MYSMLCIGYTKQKLKIPNLTFIDIILLYILYLFYYYYILHCCVKQRQMKEKKIQVFKPMGFADLIIRDLESLNIPSDVIRSH